MATLTDFARVLTEEGAAVRPLPMEAWVYGAIALSVVFLSLLLVWTFRHTARVMIEGDAHAKFVRDAAAAGHGTSGGGHP